MAIRSASIEGLDELIRATQRLSEQAMPALKVASNKAGVVVLNSAKAKASVMTRTGTLQRSLKLVKARTKGGTPITFSKVTFGKDAAYAVPLELGHDIRRGGRKVGDVGARPFLRPAADESRNQVAEILIAAMNAELDKWGDKA